MGACRVSGMLPLLVYCRLGFVTQIATSKNRFAASKIVFAASENRFTTCLSTHLTAICRK